MSVTKRCAYYGQSATKKTRKRRVPPPDAHEGPDARKGRPYIPGWPLPPPIANPVMLSEASPPAG
ncbi:MAG TPA: hypothetical protein VFQ36_02540 [Ktedonobacteraceae bacterium]|nr:hypothetical protein [Ktedonobacteraceae bacterium]